MRWAHVRDSEAHPMIIEIRSSVIEIIIVSKLWSVWTACGEIHDRCHTELIDLSARTSESCGQSSGSITALSNTDTSQRRNKCCASCVDYTLHCNRPWMKWRWWVALNGVTQMIQLSIAADNRTCEMQCSKRHQTWQTKSQLHVVQCDANSILVCDCCLQPFSW